MIGSPAFVCGGGGSVSFLKQVDLVQLQLPTRGFRDMLPGKCYNFEAIMYLLLEFEANILLNTATRRHVFYY